VVTNACGSVVSDPASYAPKGALHEFLASLVGNVQLLVAAGQLSPQQGANLSRPLLRAADFVKAGNFPAATNRLDAFVARVSAFLSAGALSPGQASKLSGDASDLRADLVD